MPKLTYGTGYRATVMSARSAHDRVTAADAVDGFENLGIDWPVSGDDSLTDYGRRGMRSAVGPLIWRGRGVRPDLATSGIRVGDSVELYGGETLDVERVGTEAGFGRNEYGELVRWDAAGVYRIYPAGQVRA